MIILYIQDNRLRYSQVANTTYTNFQMAEVLFCKLFEKLCYDDLAIERFCHGNFGPLKILVPDLNCQKCLVQLDQFCLIKKIYCHTCVKAFMLGFISNFSSTRSIHKCKMILMIQLYIFT